MVDLSIVLPIYNEEQNLGILYKELKEVLDKLNKKYELIFVDDGSKDRSFLVLKFIKEKDPKVKIIRFRKNFGQTAAMDAGIRASKGNIIITLDSDLQNDPRDIPRLIEKINQGYDVVSGWRYNRKDSLSKKFMSRGANILRKLILNDKIHDSGCTLKAYKKECFNNFRLYGETHRFIPALLKLKGFKVTEIKVNHRPRRFGKTKYTIKRTLNGFLDMLLINFWMKYSTKPIHLFGGVGIFSILIGGISGFYLTFLKLFYGEAIANRPLLILAVLLILIGFIMLIFGLLADILVKIYYKDQESYNIKTIL
jgi:glycosyltransferase involved in cell wall biosynthesis